MARQAVRHYRASSIACAPVGIICKRWDVTLGLAWALGLGLQGAARCTLDDGCTDPPTAPVKEAAETYRHKSKPRAVATLQEPLSGACGDGAPFDL
ncbi:uncharacterized protein FTOL_09150 [Fusarium torulosum]|uniref:Uncharacterized protein n=1 Tax=Fusarium torulosum TaxID=33205 RepID=A0AAE8MF52_9HYPO|nr:uncharacterized protein FTOL_09150 [Fusarium torulosum]